MKNLVNGINDQVRQVVYLTALIILSVICPSHCVYGATLPSLELVSTTFTGKSNGVFNPGGTFGLQTTLTAVNETAPNASGALSSSDACVNINQSTASFGNIAVSQNVSNASSLFKFSISSTCPAGHLINLSLILNATGYSSSAIIIPVLVSIPSIPLVSPPYNCLTNYYVSMNGNDSNNGTSTGQAWHTVSHAIAVLDGIGGKHGGVCVNVQPGTYNEYNYASGLGGSSDTPDGYLVFRSLMPYGATIQIPAANALNVSDDDFRFDQEHYIVIDGFNLAGQVIPGSIESGVVSNSYGAPGDHLKVINCLLHDHGGAGIGAVHTDYLTVEGNIVFNNANTSSYEVSGISTWQAVASNLATGYHNIISNNIVYNNTETSDGHATHSDGNGIIIDDFRNTQNSSTYGVYAPQTLIENNLVFHNGGAGIHVYLSNNATVRNNTTYGNELDPIGLGTWRGEINAINSANDIFVNNIANTVQAANIWGAPNVSLLDNSTNGSNTNNIWHNNLSFNGTLNQAATMISGSSSTITSAQGNLLGKNPGFVNPGANEFTLQGASPAINTGTNSYGYTSSDLAGNVRSSNAIDMGAYQYYPVSSFLLSISNTGNGFGNTFGSTSTSTNLINCGVNTGATLCSATLNSGTALTLTASPSSSSSFNGWTISGSPSGTCTGQTNPCVITVNAATSITANYIEKTYQLTSSAGTGGSMSPLGTTNANYGSNRTFNITPSSGNVAQLTVDGSSVSLANNTYTLNNITSNHVLAASFASQTFTLNAGFGGGGIIIPYGNISVKYGASQTFTLTPSAGYSILQLTVDGSPVALTNNTYTLNNITTNHSLSATFSQQTETLNAGFGGGGIIMPYGKVSVSYGSNQTFTLKSSSGYQIEQLLVDGTPVALTNNTYTLTNIKTNHSLSATFKLI